MNKSKHYDVAIIGAGLAGIASAYYLTKRNPALRIALIDHRLPLSFTSAQSGNNYRSWWPHPVMQKFMQRSIDLMDEIAVISDNAIKLNRSGYLLASRNNTIDDVYGLDQNLIR
ncbi:MAG: FAD-binding oxidoreductase, partial [Gammaproteobacteria bacterium]|nr:FAD-binding oxidoreductase [Gammaproteobacteria bacterium]